jgi:L-lactate dehydrogenase complex protein LldG
MTADRASILDRIRQSLQSAHLPAARATLSPRTMAATSPDKTALVDSFTRELTALRGGVRGPQPPAQTSETVIGLLRESGGNEILAWADDALPVPALGESLRRAGFTILDPTVSPNPDSRREKQSYLARASAGVTGALAGLADTGSLVLTSGPARPRFASLLPPTHIALLSVADLHPSLPAFFAARPDLARAGSNVVIITGPSRTADIELTTVYGVHGPKVLHVVLIGPG